MGLLDKMFGDPSSQALYALGSGLLGVRKGGEGRAFMGAMGAYNEAQQEQRRNELVQLQRKQIEAMLKRQERQEKDEDAFRGVLSDPSIVSPGQPEIQGNEMDPGQPALPPALDQQRMIQAFLRSGNPALVQKAMELSARSPLMKLGAGDTLVDPHNPTRPVFTAPSKPAEDPADWRLYELARGQGYKGDYTQWKKELNASGAANVSYGAPIVGMDPVTQKPIFYRPDNRGGMTPTGVSPPPDKKDPSGQTPEAAAKIQLMRQGVDSIDFAEKLIIVRDKQGKPTRLNRALVANVNSPVSVGTDARSVRTAIKNAVEAKLRLETGAAAPDPEVERIADRFMPTPMDTMESAQFKLNQLRSFFSGSLSLTKGAPERIDQTGKTVEFKDLK